ncbi:CHAT domain-containing protein [Nocardioides donggukensis]|uniref:CHAT domain-containing protein n=1 Tax=Nocardioides donggukensis TaxID=2774019 RepID=A0A927K8A4_9ACTN|nr:CHAT domain-containing protein [Nocardioides donggukensis]MBD8871025.1 CHAT domain-containing protein [Nocardioides donggukensis]
MVTPTELHRRGVAAMNAGRFDRAREALERARTLATDPDLLTRIELSTALVLSQTRRTAEALEMCDAAGRRGGLSSETTGLLHSQRALILTLHGDTTASLGEFEQALSELEDDVLRGRVHLNRGMVYLQQGRSLPAERDFSRAMRHFRAAGNGYLAAKAGHNLGYARLLEGDLAGALRQLEAANPVLAPDGPVMEATINQDRAEALIAAGQLTEGRELLRAAARVYGRRRLHRQRGEAELALARTLLLADPAAALRAARAARTAYDRVGSDAWRVRADAVALTASVEMGRKAPSLVERGDGLAEELDGQGLHRLATQLRLELVRVLVRRGRLEEARARLAGLRPGPESPLAVRLLLRTARAELAEASGRRAEAFRQARTGLGELHAWQSSFGSLDLQTGVVGQGRRLAVGGLRLAVDSGSPTVLYEWSERGRMLASWVQPVHPPADERTAADLAELRRLQIAEGVDGPDGADRGAVRRAAELRRRVRERAWQTPGSGEVTEPVPLEEVRRALGTDDALVAWVVGNECVVGLVVTDERIVRHELGPVAPVRALLEGLLPDLDVAASDLPPTLADAVRVGLTARLERLGRLLVAPLLPAIGDRRVVATPSGGLAGTPWTLLPGLRGRPVTLAPSATGWVAGRARPLRLGTAGFVAGPRVARAEDEVRQAAGCWPGASRLAGAAATAAAVARLAGEVDVLHVAAHGRHSADNPLFSGVELAGGAWFGYDIDLLERVPQVVILSACEVGRSSVRFGEELIGMTAAWLHAGVRCVVASPSAVADTAAHDVLTEMHRGLAGGQDPAAALAAAIPGPGAEVAPAPFVCFGAGW